MPLFQREVKMKMQQHSLSLFSFLFVELPQVWQQLDWLVANTMMCFGPWILYIMAYEKKNNL